MRKRITITIECETNKDDAYITKVMNRGMYRSLDSSPHYISAPTLVESVEINVYTHPEEINYSI